MKISKEGIRLKLSECLLNIAEKYPPTNNDLINSLKRIRKDQRKWALDNYHKRERPNNSKVTLSNLNIIYTFEHQNFNQIVNGLEKHRPNDEKTNKLRKRILDSEDHLSSFLWSNLGHFIKSEGLMSKRYVVDSEIPNLVNHISIQYTRLLPSLACISIQCHVEPSFTEKLESIRSRPYLGPIVFNRFWPFTKISQSYEGRFYSEDPKKTIEESIISLEYDIEKWVLKRFGWKENDSIHKSSLRVFTTEASSNSEAWLLENKNWTEDYGIKSNNKSFFGDGFILNESENNSKKDMTLTKLKNHRAPTTFTPDEEPFILASSLYSIIEKYQINLEKLRGEGFRNLHVAQKLKHHNQNIIIRIYRTTISIKRLHQELSEHQKLVELYLVDAGDIYNHYDRNHRPYASSVVPHIKNELVRFKDIIEIIDNGLTKVISTQSTYAMFSLQKKVFWLSVVVTLATFVSILGSWKDILGFFRI
jgi:hypothetical protein